MTEREYRRIVIIYIDLAIYYSIRFIKQFRKRPPRNLDLASAALLDLLDAFLDDDNMDDEQIDDIESYICYELYDW